MKLHLVKVARVSRCMCRIDRFSQIQAQITIMLLKRRQLSHSCNDYKPVVAVDPICDIMANARGDNLSVGVNSSI